MRIAVTGASGFVGGRIARVLSSAGHDVIAFGRRPSSELHAPLENYRVWDLARDGPRRLDVDAIVHSAALVGDWGPDAEYDRANVGGTRVVLESSSSAARVIVISTASVYSDGLTKTMLRENAPTGECLTAYGRSKAAAEELVFYTRSDAVVLRPHVIYGPGDTTLLPRVVQAIRLGQLVIPGSGANVVSITHVDNLVLAVSRALATRAEGAFNIADAAPVAIGTALRGILDRIGVAAPLRFVPRSIAWRAAGVFEALWPTRRAPRGPLLTRYLVTQLADEFTLDIGRARDFLGYAPRWSYVDGPLSPSPVLHRAEQ